MEEKILNLEFSLLGHKSASINRLYDVECVSLLKLQFSYQNSEEAGLQVKKANIWALL